MPGRLSWCEEYADNVDHAEVTSVDDLDRLLDRLTARATELGTPFNVTLAGDDGTSMEIVVGAAIATVQWLGRKREYEQPPVVTWQALINHVHDLQDVQRLADSANSQSLTRYADTDLMAQRWDFHVPSSRLLIGRHVLPAGRRVGSDGEVCISQGHRTLAREDFLAYEVTTLVLPVVHPKAADV